MLGGFPYLFSGVFFRAVWWKLQCLDVVSFKKGFDVMLFVPWGIIPEYQQLWIASVEVSEKVYNCPPVYFIVEAVVLLFTVDHTVSMKTFTSPIKFHYGPAAAEEPSTGHVRLQTEGGLIQTKEYVASLYVVGYHPTRFFLKR